MKNKALLIVDVQNDFVTGSLGSDYAKNVVVPNIVELAKEFDDSDIYATLDTHWDNIYPKTQEGQRLPVKHCINGTEGHRLVPEIDDIVEEDSKHRIIKTVFGLETENLFATFFQYKEVHIVGLCTDICVVCNALGFKSHTHLSHIRVIVHENCCGGTSKEAHDAAITVMKSCQIDVL